MFQKLGFVTHPIKSVLELTHGITYLGFEINSVTMTVRSTEEKKEKIKNLANESIDRGHSQIRELTKFIGMVVVSFRGVKYGALMYRSMENDKIQALKIKKGTMTLRRFPQKQLF